MRHHRSSTLWITCVLRFKDWRHPLDEPHVWTPLFFLDDAVALAAGHRPCATCRRADYVAYRDAVDARTDRAGARRRSSSTGGWHRSACAAAAGFAGERPAAVGRRRSTRCPPARSIVRDGIPHLVGAATLQPFSFAGWGPPRSRDGGEVAVLTPPTSVAALAGGFRPTLHPSAADRSPACQS